jgi:hypothetical protein
MFDIVIAFLTSFCLTFLVIPPIISIAKKKNLMDEPGDRRSHQVSTPSLGGIGIFAGVVFSVIMWTPFQVFGDLQFILCAFIILFLIGAKDDIDPCQPYQKDRRPNLCRRHPRIQGAYQNHKPLWDLWDFRLTRSGIHRPYPSLPSWSSSMHST